MFQDIEGARLLAMSPQEQRWLANLKKAFYQSDVAYVGNSPENGAMENICKAIDAAQMLRKSLRGSDCSPGNNKMHFTEFIDLDVPNSQDTGMALTLTDSRSGKPVSFSQIVYAIRCIVVHENENLNASEGPDYHIQLDWTMSEHDRVGGILRDGMLILNARSNWNRIREVAATFITGLDFFIAVETGDSGSMTVQPPYLSIRP